ncbi:hypothetical protein TPA0910_13670 [Streptomyces hygroscopicus subsp. sporocinereus]|uniref:Uncharacterized protein n=2 Tax=Streptomyces TaxID=1883 RepID=A0ABQ3TUF4_STRHY|nr:hypothetical protein TPA0910_13670 [Streptomyces hygroscopicus]
MTGEGWQPARAWPICDLTREPAGAGLRIGALAPGTGGTLTDLHEPLDSYPDELPPPRRRGDVNLVSLLSMAEGLAKEMSALHIRAKCSDPEVAIMPREMVQENLEQHAAEVLEKVVYLQRRAHAAMLGRCVLGADSKEDCSTEGADLQLNVWDDTTRRDIVEDGTTGCVAHTVEAARRAMADPASRKILLAFNR